MLVCECACADECLRGICQKAIWVQYSKSIHEYTMLFTVFGRFSNWSRLNVNQSCHIEINTILTLKKETKTKYSSHSLAHSLIYISLFRFSSEPECVYAEVKIRSSSRGSRSIYLWPDRIQSIHTRPLMDIMSLTIARDDTHLNAE